MLPILGKPSFDAFERTDLDQSLKRKKITALLLSGVFLDVCVAETAKTAAGLGYDVFVIEDMTEPNDRDDACYERNYMREKGVRFIDSPQVESVLRSRYA